MTTRRDFLKKTGQSIVGAAGLAAASLVLPKEAKATTIIPTNRIPQQNDYGIKMILKSGNPAADAAMVGSCRPFSHKLFMRKGK